MTVIRFVLGDQLTRSLSSLRDADPARDVVLMAEVHEEATYVRHHKQKLTFVLSAMRHFAAQLREEGFTVRYVRLDDDAPPRDFTGALSEALAATGAERVVITEPSEWRVMEAVRAWEATLGAPVEVRDDDRFYCSIDQFRAWAQGKSRLLMEYFYRAMRQRTGVLMEGGGPVGGRWNFDAENRKPWPKGQTPPPTKRFAPDETTRAVMQLVEERFKGHFGALEPFGWAVTRDDALAALAWFIDHALPDFGDRQDAMVRGEAFLCHSALSPYLNIGLLEPREVVDAALRALKEGRAPLNAVEGFIRQILGWREYVRGVYWLKMPAYAQTNALGADQPLPWFYWSGETDMACVKDVVQTTRTHAYAHHIQRLMIAGTLALLWGVKPSEIEDWFLVVYADAYDWVELPNVHGMAIYADGGLLASKPYAAGGAYINRMSDYCRSCRFDPKKRIGKDACPFTTLYWDFLMRNQSVLKDNIRLAMPYKSIARFDPAETQAIATRAMAIRSGRDAV